MATRKTIETKKPTGLTITRSGEWFTLKWKIGDKNYGDGQQLQYKLSTHKKWHDLSVGRTTTSRSVKVAKTDFYPTSGKKKVVSISFRVRGNRQEFNKGSGRKEVQYKCTWSDWAKKKMELFPPLKPSVTVELNSELTNVCKFKWSVEVKNDSVRPYTGVIWQSMIAPKGSNVSDGSKLKWENNNSNGWTSGTSTASSGEREITEQTETLASGSYTRWFRIRARGIAGASTGKPDGWTYEKHVYSVPYRPKVGSVTASENAVGGFSCKVVWEAASSNAYPIDKTTVQYTIVEPEEDLTCPSGASWTDANVSRDTKDNDAVFFSIDDTLSKDQCLFVRVNTQHDSHITYGTPTLAKVGYLKDPTGLSVEIDNTTHRATVTATNASGVPDAFLVVMYQTASDPSGGFPVGIIPTGSQRVTVQCPDWSQETAVSFGVYAAVGSYQQQTRSDGVSAYTVNARMRSKNTVWDGGAVPTAPDNVGVAQTAIKGTVQITWDWTWAEANGAEISWADHADAWESTDEPETYKISRLHASKWNISGLATGVTWYMRVRLVNETADGVTNGPWSELTDDSIIDLSSAPTTPNLYLSSAVIPQDGSVTASWAYTTTDGTAQAYAEICEATISSSGITYGSYRLSEDTTVIVNENELNGKTYYARSGAGTYESPYVYTEVTVTAESNPVGSGWYEFFQTIAHTETAQQVAINAKDVGWQSGQTYNLCVRVTSASGNVSDTWSDPVSVTIADPLEAHITSTTLEDKLIIDDVTEGTQRTVPTLTQLPLSVMVTGAGVGGTTTLAIERAEDYQLERPDGRNAQGYAEETVYLFSQTGEDPIMVTVDDLIGALDDGASYRLVATVQDGLGQSASDSLTFEVHWDHQALMPQATVEIDEDNYVAKITPIAPSGTRTGDVCDIYRLSADRPELIVQDGTFGTTYVDPYPALGEFGGHRVVFKTANGDYITEDNQMAWIDLDEDDGDILDLEYNVIDFEGTQVLLYYNVDLSSQWSKDFTETKYLGGAVQGDWNPAVSRTGSISATTITLTDQETIRKMRMLATYAGICHVRTRDGSSYSADIQVSEEREHEDYDKIATFSLTVTRVDPEGFEGVPIELWQGGQ